MQTFSSNFVEDKQLFEKFWPFYLNSKIAGPKSFAGREGPVGLVDYEGDLEDLSLGLDFELRAFSGGDLTLSGTFWIQLFE